MSLAIIFLTMPTGATGATGIARIDQDHAHARSLCLVAEEQSQLVEGPTRALPSLRPSNRCSLPNPFQVFERECLTVVFSLTHKSLADFVVDLALKMRLFARELTQAPASAARIRLLQSLTVLKASFTYLSDLRAAVLLTIRVDGKINQTKIDAK
ncbi:MAG TPA: hypothetical protein VKE41_16855, partial [Roseiflexaceae bacterium]|nr:hypothetical protein [Roseiflexaceae bacterium]